MKWLNPFRVSTVLLVLFFFGHTAGGMLAQKSLGPDSDRVFAEMKSVHMQFNGADCTWYGFWFGLGLTVSVFLLLSAVLAWILADIEPTAWPRFEPIAWALIASQVANALLSWRYFFAGPAAIAALVVVLMSIGSVQKRRRAVVAAA